MDKQYLDEIEQLSVKMLVEDLEKDLKQTSLKVITSGFQVYAVTAWSLIHTKYFQSGINIGQKFLGEDYANDICFKLYVEFSRFLANKSKKVEPGELEKKFDFEERNL